MVHGRFKKITILALMLSVLLVFAGCSNKENTDDVKDNSSAVDETVVEDDLDDESEEIDESEDNLSSEDTEVEEDLEDEVVEIISLGSFL